MGRVVRAARKGILVTMLGIGGTAGADAPSSGRLLHDLGKLRVVGSVLYVAAHPDDENTRLIAWLEGARGVDVTYLSLTRGGGGQNLVGSEQSELLSVLRTGELLAARAIDGGDQRFTRARDFGYSKSAEEALASWGHEAVLEDVVRVVREVRPDVIITRFPTEGSTHGHHLASAILAGEAFEKAADPAYVVDGLEPWKADFVVRNESSWRIDESTDTSGWVAVDVGGYDPRLGRSWGEIAADARTMHKSQGFGSAPQLGPQLEYFSAVAGDAPQPGEDLLEGLDLSWSRLEGGAAVDRWLAKAEKKLDPRAPQAILPLLGRAYAALEGLPPGPLEPRRRQALDDLGALMRRCAGIHVTARAKGPAAVPGDPLEVELSVWMRNPAGASVEGTLLEPNVPFTKTLSLDTADLPVTRPHWLEAAPTPTLFDIPADERTLADRPGPLVAAVTFELGGQGVPAIVPVTYAWTDPVHGERQHPVELLPPVTATFGQRTRLVPAGASAEATVTLRASAGPAAGTLRLTAPDGTSVTPAEVPFELTGEAPEQAVVLQLAVGDTPGPLVATVTVDGADWSWGRDTIDHPHVPRRTVLHPAALELVPVALDRGPTDRVAYLPGSGDAVPTALRDLGYAVDLVDLDAIRSGALADYDTLVLGIRAYNTVPGLLESRAVLFDWVAAGGRMVVQYNTSNRWSDLGDIGPRPLQLGRGRVTDQTAPLEPVDAGAAVLAVPNALGPADYEGWVQERGLYFAETWDPAYQPVFRSHDAGEEPLAGSTLVLAHGEGTFVYTGLSFFRQLPAGVPGAARLFANLLAVGLESTDE